jgi:Methyltransferase FkbM domain
MGGPDIMKFDYVDIGTCDFETSVDLLKPGELGLFVEPLFYYLRRLPDDTGIIKAPLAVSNFNGYDYMNYIPESEILSRQLPSWVRGCNSFKQPHTLLAQQFPDIPQHRVLVPVVTFLMLKSVYHIERIGHLKIDTEGHDHIILQEVLPWAHQLDIQTITFEYIKTNPNVAQLDQLVNKLPSWGFTNLNTQGDNITASR